MEKYEPISVEKIRRYSLNERGSLVDVARISRPLPETRVLPFIENLPDMLAARDLKEIVRKIASARSQGRPVMLGMGGHPIKVGLSPYIVDLMDRGIITAVATNGSAIIHDFELARTGRTSEDVAHELDTGSFGMAWETGAMLNEAIIRGAGEGIGLGRAVGELILGGADFSYRNLSIFAAARRLSLPATVHVAVGTDIIHMHPEASGEAIGKTSLHDFRLFSAVVADLEGGVFINLGSAVILPEVFLKAISLVRNLGHEVRHITTVTMDFNRHYRPMENVVRRPTACGGKGYYLTGHHEIMFPLLAAAVREQLGDSFAPPSGESPDSR